MKNEKLKMRKMSKNEKNGEKWKIIGWKIDGKKWWCYPEKL